MSAKTETAPAFNTDEAKLAHALVSRGLLTKEEARQCTPPPGAETGTDALLQRLVKAGFLTPSQARRATQEMSLLMDQSIPGFQLVEKLGQGSMGTVFKARQLSMNRLVAIKILKQNLAANPDFIKRFTREAHIAAKLSHNNIVQAIDVGSAGALQYFVMEYIEGTTIRQELEAGKKYTEKEAVEIVLQIAQALQHASRRQLIHRDVKPANIVLTGERIAKLADLGMARDTGDLALARAEKGMTIGTPFYIAPEQIHGREDIDVRADIYSLGATLYHMVTGQAPFPDEKVDDVLDAHLHRELTPPDHLNLALSSGLGEVVEFMMAKDRRQRYPTPDDLILDLECLLNGEPPKLARQRIEATTLKELAEGETEDDAEATAAATPPHWIWLAVLGGLLALSALLNLILLVRR
jgi:serine/threonine protein kinase